MVNRHATDGNAFHMAGKFNEARARFMMAEMYLFDVSLMSLRPIVTLVGIQNSFYCDFLLYRVVVACWRIWMSRGHQAVSQECVAACQEARKRTENAIAVVGDLGSLLASALDRLQLGTSAFLLRILQNDFRGIDQNIHEHFEAALKLVKLSSDLTYTPLCLMAKAWSALTEDDSEGAVADLDEAWDIAQRGPMRLHMADIHLYRARLFFREKPYPWKSPQDDLAAARQLIEQCGYWRRKEELEDAEEAAKTW